MEGVVVELKMLNPHPTLTVEVTDANGQKGCLDHHRESDRQRTCEGWLDARDLGSRNPREGRGAPPRREGTKALAAGAITRMTDGKVLSFGGVGNIAAG